MRNWVWEEKVLSSGALFYCHLNTISVTNNICIMFYKRDFHENNIMEREKSFRAYKQMLISANFFLLSPSVEWMFWVVKMYSCPISHIHLTKVISSNTLISFFHAYFSPHFGWHKLIGWWKKLKTRFCSISEHKLWLLVLHNK